VSVLDAPWAIMPVMPTAPRFTKVPFTAPLRISGPSVRKTTEPDPLPTPPSTVMPPEPDTSVTDPPPVLTTEPVETTLRA
jgi:hypothetical protein